jgi:hypothetical protein
MQNVTAVTAKDADDQAQFERMMRILNTEYPAIPMYCKHHACGFFLDYDTNVELDRQPNQDLSYQDFVELSSECARELSEAGFRRKSEVMLCRPHMTYSTPPRIVQVTRYLD